MLILRLFFFFFQAEDGIRDVAVTGVQTCALPILAAATDGRIDDTAAARRPLAHRSRQDRNMVGGGQGPPEKDESPACRGRRGRVRRPARRVQAGLTGLEPATSGVTDRHSNQLSYSPLRRRGL